MIVPVSPIADFYNRLLATSALANIRVRLGARELAAEGAPPRIVLFPVDAKHVPSRDKVQNVRDADRHFAARMWGDGYDQAYYLVQQFFQALEEQAANQNPKAGAPTGPGWYWQSVGETWNVAADTAKHGESVDVEFTIIQPVARVAQTQGLILSNQLTGTKT